MPLPATTMMLRRRAFFFSAFALLRADAFLPTSRCAISLPQSGLAPTCQNRFSQTSKIVLPHLDNTSLSSALEASPAATVAAVAVAPPSLKAVALACAIPTLLGYYKSEYGVSYAYGTGQYYFLRCSSWYHSFAVNLIIPSYMYSFLSR